MRTNGMRHVQLLNASPPKIGARGNDDNERRQHNAEGGRGLQPAGTVAAAFVRDVVGDISDSAACLTSNLGPISIDPWTLGDLCRTSISAIVEKVNGEPWPVEFDQLSKPLRTR